MPVKIKISNSSGIPLVRFRGVFFDSTQFVFDIADGCTETLSEVPNGDVGLVAFRLSDQRLLDTLFYPISDSFGFSALLIPTDDPYVPYRLVGEVFVIPD